MSDNDSEHLIRPSLTRLDVFGRFGSTGSLSDNISISGCHPPSAVASSHQSSSNEPSLRDYDVIDDQVQEVPPGTYIFSDTICTKRYHVLFLKLCHNCDRNCFKIFLEFCVRNFGFVQLWSAPLPDCHRTNIWQVV